jgi:hypothetical protein
VFLERKYKIMKEKRTLIYLLAVVILLSGCTKEEDTEKTAVIEDKFQAVVQVYRDRDTGFCSLKVNEYLLHEIVKKARTFKLRSLWEYNHSEEKWYKVEFKYPPAITLQPQKRDIYSYRTARTVLELPMKIVLFYVEWEEDGKVCGALATSGPVLCNDLRIGKPPKGMVAACFPFPKSSRAMFVTDPTIHCRE